MNGQTVVITIGPENVNRLILNTPILKYLQHFVEGILKIVVEWLKKCMKKP